MANEPIQGGPYPAPSDAPDGPSQIKAVVDWAAPRTNMRFASAAARDAAIPAPVAGMECSIGIGTSIIKYLHDGVSWRDIWSDTEWTTIPASAGNTSTAQARVLQGVLYLRGVIRSTNGSNWAAGIVVLGTLPVGMRPALRNTDDATTTITGQSGTGGPAPLQAWITTAGAITIYSTGSNALHARAVLTGLSGLPVV